MIRNRSQEPIALRTRYTTVVTHKRSECLQVDSISAESAPNARSGGKALRDARLSKVPDFGEERQTAEY